MSSPEEITIVVNERELVREWVETVDLTYLRYLPFINFTFQHGSIRPQLVLREAIPPAFAQSLQRAFSTYPNPTSAVFDRDTDVNRRNPQLNVVERLIANFTRSSTVFLKLADANRMDYLFPKTAPSSYLASAGAPLARFLDLPDELLVFIISLTSGVRVLAMLSQTCRRMRSFAGTEDLWRARLAAALPDVEERLSMIQLSYVAHSSEVTATCPYFMPNLYRDGIREFCILQDHAKETSKHTLVEQEVYKAHSAALHKRVTACNLLFYGMLPQLLFAVFLVGTLLLPASLNGAARITIAHALSPFIVCCVLALIISAPSMFCISAVRRIPAGGLRFLNTVFLVMCWVAGAAGIVLFALIGASDAQYQATGFSFSPMTYLWPLAIVIGALCLCVVVLLLQSQMRLFPFAVYMVGVLAGFIMIVLKLQGSGPLASTSWALVSVPFWVVVYPAPLLTALWYNYVQTQWRDEFPFGFLWPWTVVSSLVMIFHALLCVYHLDTVPGNNWFATFVPLMALSVMASTAHMIVFRRKVKDATMATLYYPESDDD
eukprot:TRINITY_DN2613_c0_g3_i1.p1 TRINITY_DN2613_c0_g3~~TRINITY_DN2613_c0_g3_i1.p1  ORF type:complete len:547 (+),score=82.95 TRINITY_DN2613_c0_g3_i1:136-1776(+)